MRPGKRKALDKSQFKERIADGCSRLTHVFVPRGASVFGHQAAVRICQSARQRLGQEHRADSDVFCFSQFVDGAGKNHGIAGISVPVNSRGVLGQGV